MPTFKVFLQGREIKEMRGADRNGLQTMINESIQFYNQKLILFEWIRKVSDLRFLPFYKVSDQCDQKKNWANSLLPKA